ncbi:M16 family metallopeptidase [Pseudomonas lopnurensis]|uniref:M16 family metallopeptidase n=1 Tax=Pseudomonas lopnurensis TaxID=1477517 RepID=UPI0028B0A0FE|nr:pitrilysin family protein [Pseudomonas lopnurensis]
MKHTYLLGARRSIALVLALLALAGNAWAGMKGPVAELGGIKEYRLDNGLRVVLAPDASSNTLYFNLVYRSGSLADPDGRGGTAHLLEHLMFKGTAQRTAESLVDGLRQRGIRFNATTSFDRTRYTAVFEADASRLEHLLELEAERMAGLRFEQRDLDSEIEVVLREMERAQDDPLGALGHRMMAAATPGQGFGRHVLGSREELRAIQLADLRRFHESHYRPDNAVLVITGKFDQTRTLDAVSRHFAKLKPAADNPTTEDARIALPQGRPATAQVKQGNTDVVALAYPVPAAADPRNVALAALADVFAGEPHGRLYQALVAPGVAQGVFALQQAFEHGGYYLFGAMVAPGQSMEDAQALLIGQIESMSRQRLSSEELQRAQASGQHMKARILLDPGALADVLSESAAIGGWQLLLERFDQFSALDVETVQGEAEAHFSVQRRLVGQLRAGSEAAAPVERRTGPTATAQPAAAPTALQTMPDLAGFNRQILDVEQGIQRTRLRNGLKVALRAQPGSSKPVQGIMTLRFGNVESLHGKRAVADITGTVLVRGSRDSSYQQIVDRANRLGAGLAVVPDGGALIVRFESSGESFPALLELMAEVLQRPAFTRAEYDLVKRQRLQALRIPADQPASVAGLALRRHVERYAEGDIRRRVEHEEMRAAMKAVSLKDVRRFHEDFYGASHGELAIAGDFDAAQVTAQLDRLFGGWTSKTPHHRTTQPYEDIAPARIHAKANAAQTGHYIGRLHFQANARSEDTAALFVAEHVLGRHPLASRLGKRLREQEGLTYDLRSSIKVATFDDASWVNVQGSYSLGQGQRVADIVKEEVARLAESGITQQELDAAKATILNERRQAFGQDLNILNWLPRQLYEDVTLLSWVERNDAFAAVTLEQVNAVARRYFDAERMVEVLADAE